MPDMASTKAIDPRRAWSRAVERTRFTGEKPSWLLYMLVGVFALLKDMFDFVFGVIPGVGIALSFVFGICFSTTIFLLLTVFDRSGGGSAKNRGAARQFVRRIIALLSAVLVDMLPIVSFLPVTTLSIIVLYVMALRDWKKARKEHGESMRASSRAYA